MVRSAAVVSGQYGGGGKEKTLIGGKLQKRKVRPPPVLPPPLRSALPLTEIASKAGPTKNSLDFTLTLRTIVFPSLTVIGRTLQPIRAWLLITWSTSPDFVSPVCGRVSININPLHCGSICCQQPTNWRCDRTEQSDVVLRGLFRGPRKNASEFNITFVNVWGEKNAYPLL